MSLSKITSILLFLLMGVSAVLLIIFYTGPNVPGTTGTSMEEPKVTETILNWAYILLIATAAISLVFPVVQIFSNPKNIKKALVSLGVAAVVILVAYMFASDEVLKIHGYDGTDNVPSTLKWVDTGLYALYILAGGAILLILYSEISRAFK